ncbi:hypothetical protein QPK31_24835 [Massilia sp. YIM B02769]|uniref:hypothetical protein n=1 Tax=Massilia sp. YIM B02769 TaxID=3050129 RepID=UPI0025B72448|nr:hypothetical protein [Massilia sp. YIM B02769]MDN4061452.1 hypothetical protein [Massilia sp. YIM B02769]
MKARVQIALSALSAPGAAFIALQRMATGQPWWAALWLFVAIMHGWMLIDSARELRRQRAATKINKE